MILKTELPPIHSCQQLTSATNLKYTTNKNIPKTEKKPPRTTNFPPPVSVPEDNFLLAGLASYQQESRPPTLPVKMKFDATNP
jgi:hypothetical protein